MDHQNVQSSQNMSLVLSTDAKPRLKWTPELHQRFVDAVNHLGGPEKATPKSLMRMMGIPGLTLYHLKSHLQKFRLVKNQQSEIVCKDVKQETVDCEDNCSLNNELNLFNETNENPIQENADIAQALQIQMEVQRKLHEQIEVQKHLQLRIEAQGKYLQKVLKKAQETFSGYNCSETGVENAKSQLFQLVSLVSSSSLSGITEITDLSLDNNLDRKCAMGLTRCSVESSLTSSESSERIDEEIDTTKYGQETHLLILPLFDKPRPQGLRSRKRSRGTISKGTFVQEKYSKNSQCENDLSSGPKEPIIDLNLKL